MLGSMPSHPGHYGEDSAWRALGPVWAVASMHSEVSGLHCGCFPYCICRFGLRYATKRLSHQTHSSVFQKADFTDDVANLSVLTFPVKDFLKFSPES